LIYNLPGVTGPNCTGIDAKTVESIVQKNLSITGAKINKVARLGKTKENSPRSLLVSMADKVSKWQCLKHESKLRNDAKLCNVYLSTDLILKEREVSKKLYLELKDHRKKGEKDLVIRHGKNKTSLHWKSANSANPTVESTPNQ